MNINIQEIKSDIAFDNEANVTIIPVNYQEGKNYKYTSSSLSFYKYCKGKIGIGLYSEPELLYEKRASDWFAPTIIVTSLMIFENPEIVSIICGVISNYITDLFKGQKKPTIHLTVVHKETKTSKLTEINYNGSVEGLDKLKDAVLEISKKK